jgi:hypothetical protein
MNNISSAKVPKKRVNKVVLNHMLDLIENARYYIANKNITGKERVDLMCKHGRTLLYACMGMYNERGDYTSGVKLLARAYGVSFGFDGKMQRGRDLMTGLSNIDDQDLRAFAFASVSMYMRSYLKIMIPNSMDRFFAMLYAGQRIFTVKPGSSARSPRLWNIMYSALPNDTADVLTLHEASGVWCSAVQNMHGLAKVQEGFTKALDGLFNTALGNQSKIDRGEFTTDVNEIYDVLDVDDFDY